MGRISFLLAVVVFTAIATNSGMARRRSKSSGTFHLPAEWENHNGTYMVFPASAEIWKSEDNLYMVRGDIIRIAKAISDFETVSLLVEPDQVEIAESMIGGNRNIKIFPMPVDDLWARDTLPIFGYRGEDNELVGVNFNFNGWGEKQEHRKDGKIARRLMKKLHMPKIDTFLRGEGGALETDGEGTLLVTESSLIMENRNKEGRSRDEIEEELKRVFGVEKVIWFKGVYKKDITDAHVDCLVRYIKPGVVVLNRPTEGTDPGDDVWGISSEDARKVLERETDAKGRKFQVINMYEPDDSKVKDKHGDAFLTSYVNFFIANGAVIVPEFGDKDADRKAQKILEDNFPGRKIVPVSMPALAAGGGGIHCATHDVPCYTTSSDGRRVKGSCDK